MGKVKTELLKKFEQKEPKLFIQYDALDASNKDSFLPQYLEEIVGKRLDIDKHLLEASLTYELMRGSDVRVLINPETSKETVLMLLDKIKDQIKENEDWQIGATEELNKFNKLKELESTLKKLTSEDGYTLDDIEYLFNSIKVMRDKKKEAEKTPKVVVDEEIPF